MHFESVPQSVYFNCNGVYSKGETMSTATAIKIVVVVSLFLFGASLLSTLASTMDQGQSIPDIIASIHAGDL